jgi:tetratricopeptide (TPR) repeat protein
MRFFDDLYQSDRTTGDWVKCWWACFRNLLIFLPYPENYHFRLLNELKSYYNGKKVELGVIGEFERNYNPQRAVWWYTKSTFLFYILNRAFRQYNIRLLLLFGFWIQDLYRTLKDEHERFRNTRLPSESIIKVYRGQVISCEESHILEDTEPFVNNSPFSTSLDKQVALIFLDSSAISDELVRVLFEIEIDLNEQSVPFGTISKLSSYRTEEEILIMSGALFQYTDNDIIRDENGHWIVQLKLTSHDEMKDIRHFQCTTLRSTLKRCISDLINNFNLPSSENINIIFNELMSIYPIEAKWISAIKLYCCSSSIKICRSINSYQLALPYYDQAYEIWMSYLHDDDLNSSIHIADILVRKSVDGKDKNKSIGYLRRAIRFYLRGIKEKKTGNIYELIENINSLIETYEKKIKLVNENEKVSDALTAIKWEKLHIQLMKKYPDASGDMTIDFYLTRIGQIYELIERYDNALCVYQQTLHWCIHEAKEVDLFYVADVYGRIASILTHHKKNRYLALRYELLRHQCILELFTLKRTETTRSKQNKMKKIIESHLRVADVAIELSDYDLAKEHLDTALTQQLELKQIKEQLRDSYNEPGLWNAFNSQCEQHQTHITITKDKLEFVKTQLDFEIDFSDL